MKTLVNMNMNNYVGIIEGIQYYQNTISKQQAIPKNLKTFSPLTKCTA